VAALGLNRVRQTETVESLNPCVQPRAATEGRPYSTYDSYRTLKITRRRNDSDRTDS